MPLILIVEFALALRTLMGLDPPNATRLERRWGNTMARGQRSRRGRKPDGRMRRLHGAENNLS
jgi:hypothetical protein